MACVLVIDFEDIPFKLVIGGVVPFWATRDSRPLLSGTLNKGDLW